MARDELKIDSRRRRILEILRRDGQVRVAELGEALDTTVVTVRNDLAVLERDGYCLRIPGGAIRTAPKFTGLEFRHRTEQREEQKRRIAAAVVELVQDGDTLMINSGTTTYLAAMELKKRKNLSVVTNSLPIAVELSAVPGFRTLLLGGSINSEFAFTFGSIAAAELRQYKANSAILSVDGISSDTGLTTLHAEEAELNRVMMDRSGKTIIVADSTKIDRESFFNFGSLSSNTRLVTDTEGDSRILAEFGYHGVQILQC
jgi:DeoR/GlpR family transcriptional regulator of sugar metabolism